jgi:hypothetical protein
LSEFELSELWKLPHSLAERNLRDRSLTIQSEDSLCEMISVRVKEDKSCFRLLEFVRLEFLPQSTMQRFVDLSEKHLDNLTVGRWRSVSVRLALEVSQGRPDDPPPEGREEQAAAEGDVHLEEEIPDFVGGFVDLFEEFWLSQRE